MRLLYSGEDAPFDDFFEMPTRRYFAPSAMMPITPRLLASTIVSDSLYDGLLLLSAIATPVCRMPPAAMLPRIGRAGDFLLRFCADASRLSFARFVAMRLADFIEGSPRRWPLLIIAPQYDYFRDAQHFSIEVGRNELPRRSIERPSQCYAGFEISSDAELARLAMPIGARRWPPSDAAQNDA